MVGAGRLSILGGQRFGELEHVGAERETAKVVLEAEWLQARRLGARDEDELAMRAAAKIQHHVRERLEPMLEAPARGLGALGDTAELAHLLGEQGHDAIGLHVIAGAENDRGCGFLSWHRRALPRGRG